MNNELWRTYPRSLASVMDFDLHRLQHLVSRRQVRQARILVLHVEHLDVVDE